MLHCRVLPPVELNSVISIPLPIYLKVSLTIVQPFTSTVAISANVRRNVASLSGPPCRHTTIKKQSNRLATNIITHATKSNTSPGYNWKEVNRITRPPIHSHCLSVYFTWSLTVPPVEGLLNHRTVLCKCSEGHWANLLDQLLCKCRLCLKSATLTMRKHWVWLTWVEFIVMLKLSTFHCQELKQHM